MKVGDTLAVAVLTGLYACAPKLRSPTFDDYVVAPIFQGQPAPVGLWSTPDARRFRTRLAEAETAGPNFADHFTIATWECGTDGHVIALIDGRTGRVTFVGGYEVGVSFRRDSRLVITNPPEAIAERWKLPRDCDQPWVPITAYFEWNGEALHQLQTIAQSHQVVGRHNLATQSGALLVTLPRANVRG